MAMDVAALRGWLLWNPKPSGVLVQSVDDQKHEVSVGSSSWMSIATSILALDPILVQALDEKGKLIRAVRPKEHGNTGEDGMQTPTHPLVLPPGTDPQSMLLLHFADLIAAAYRHSTDVAFERLASLFEAVNRRSESLEATVQSLERLLMKAHQQQIEAASAAPAPQENELLAMIEAFMQGRHMHANDESQNGKAG